MGIKNSHRNITLSKLKVHIFNESIQAKIKELRRTCYNEIAICTHKTIFTIFKRCNQAGQGKESCPAISILGCYFFNSKLSRASVVPAEPLMAFKDNIKCF